MKPKRRRLIGVAVALALLGAAAGLVLSAMNDSLVFFVAPSDLAAKAKPGQKLRLGGLVEDGSVERVAGTARVTFKITDGGASVPVSYEGLLPDLFREGQGVVVEGVLGADGVFSAARVLAKHDETYMPPEVAEALKKSGQWRGDKK